MKKKERELKVYEHVIISLIKLRIARRNVVFILYRV
jgi:hypothetical protein